ncbi:hypothetical protein SAMN05444004_101360 [Jannaschia faecimaris]|uniref:Uncharacterized protein n=1 Tax=Jannaschia faecimaris TaxID=1244108 RepID=A0A1H3JJZ9_9RHOB|nr:hypothetical protein [Jannaschia faecimaris]SDY40246.1 hypothetical protein SAMN05444004_101360 [Jannaschia faecimaris]
MISQLPGACIRALLMVAMVLTPSLLLPDVNSQVSDAFVLIALFAAVFVIVEYVSIYPGLIEFRSAPPFNRVRFLTLFTTLTLIALACSSKHEPSLLARLILAVGVLLGHSMDFPLSPIRLLIWILPEGTTLGQAQMVRAAAGLAYLTSLVGLTIFAIMIRVRGWPSPTGSFNVWINLPTFDPTAGGDVVKRLKRDGAVNILLGLILPYLTPPLAVYIANSYGVSMLESDLMTVWVMALWAFLPTSLFLRGIAMRRLALMISQKRRRLVSERGVPDPAFLPA